MEWNNNLQKTIEHVFKSSKVVPSDDILLAADCDRSRFLRLLRNRHKMTALELIVFAKWLHVPPEELINLTFLSYNDGII
ncbi:MAG: hypothetical protein K1X55_05545 [Chitinophagales bacterium]|nr:hypothetical protein [Chitinophagales bacterium]